MKKSILIFLVLFVVITLVGCKHKHDYTSQVVNPTCVEEGYTLYKCDCGHEYKDSVVAATGHSFGNWQVIKEATEDEAGIEERTCACGEKEQQAIPQLEHTHNYESSVVEPTCTERGYTTHTCKCGDSYNDTYIKANGHTYGDWVIVKEPTTTEQGLKERVCHCGKKESQAIKKLEDDNKEEYTITFITNQENVIWPSRSANNRTEIVNELFKDLYEWAVSNGETKSYDDYLVYIKDKIKSYADINLRNVELGNAAAEDGSTKYFLNIPKYYNKWNKFFKVFNTAMLKVNGEQSFYTDTYATMVRLYQFTEWTSDGLKYFQNYINQMKSAAQISEEVPTTYKKGDYIYLPNLALQSGLEFLGWYDNPEFSGMPIFEITDTDKSNKVFYA